MKGLIVSIDGFGVRTVSADGHATVFLHGEIDMSCGPAVRHALAAAQQRSPDVIVDLSGVTFMDSTGLNALSRAYQQAPPGGSIRVVGATSIVRRVFEITGLSELLWMPRQVLTWQQLTYNPTGWRQWITEETTGDGLPVAEIIEVGPRGNWSNGSIHYALEHAGEISVYGSLNEAMRAAELPRSVSARTSDI
jgi:stage II sporulation protein AA (anti-sigma F factor antagonist)